EKIIIFNHGREPKAWDPSIDDSDGSTVIGNIFDGLMRDKKDGSLGYGQAKSHTVSKDGLTYTFKLRDDIFWTDGKPVTAHDFAYGWMRLIDPKAGAGYAYMGTSYIKNAKAYFDGKVKADKVGVKAIDSKTFEVKLETPTAFFLNLTTFFAFMPVRKDIIEKYGDGWEKNPKTCVSNGPFYLKEFKLGEYIMLAKNKKFYDKNLVKVDKVKFEFITEQTTALNAFMNGDLYVNQEIPPAEVSKLIAEEPDLVFAPRLQTTYIIFNVDKAPFNDPRVRKAFSLALNRKALCESALKGGETPATGLIPPVLSFSDGTSCRKLDAKKRPAPEFGIDPNAARVKEAQKLLAEAG
ncbi:MAG: peptide ABC transporter substrate-binding protein, partial [Synergistaceae bacterium]